MIDNNNLVKYLKIYILLALFMATPVLAQKDKEIVKPIPIPQSFVTHHQGVFNGKSLKYIATAKETYLKDKQGASVASIWSVAYMQEGVSRSLVSVYPSETSSTIITQKPTIAPRVARSVFPCCWLSGMSSSITT